MKFNPKSVPAAWKLDPFLDDLKKHGLSCVLNLEKVYKTEVVFRIRTIKSAREEELLARLVKQHFGK